jgi:hypothetical protein
MLNRIHDLPRPGPEIALGYFTIDAHRSNGGTEC